MHPFTHPPWPLSITTLWSEDILQELSIISWLSTFLVTWSFPKYTAILFHIVSAILVQKVNWPLWISSCLGQVSPKNGWLPGRQREKSSTRSNSKNEIFMSEVSHQLLVNYLGRPDMKLGICLFVCLFSFSSFCLREIFEDLAGVSWFAYVVFFNFHPYLGEWCNLTSIFSIGWFNHPLPGSIWLNVMFFPLLQVRNLQGK